MAAIKQPRTGVATFTSQLWEITEGDVIVIKKDYFRNGESHYKGTINGRAVDLPASFFRTDERYTEKITVKL